MEYVHEQHEDLIDLGAASVETRGAVLGLADSEGQPRQIFGGISDD
jgi:hypothetical protein